MTKKKFQGALEKNKSDRSKEDSRAILGFGCTNQEERFDASLGELSEATTEFKNTTDISKGGVIFSLPALLASGLLKFTDKYFSLPSGYYNLTHIFITLAFIAMLRFQSIESVKHCNPAELGKILGLDRIPEIKTIREKLSILADSKKIKDWSVSLSKEWMEMDPELAGVLYVDGHVRVYHGKKTQLPRRYVARQKLCLRGVTDYWLNDAIGQPYFVINSFQTKGLLSMIKENIIPRLLEEVPNQPDNKTLKRNPYIKRFALVFDREGYSPVFFKEMWEKHRISCYTYHKYAKDVWNEDEFQLEVVELQNGEKIKMLLAERGIYLSGKIWLREVRKLTKNGHQTALISTDYTSNIRQLSVNMFSRWSQENFFKYMRQHFGIDRLIEYETMEIDDTVKVKNPKYRELEKKIRSINQKLYRKKKIFGEIVYKETKNGAKIQKYIQEKAELLEAIELLCNEKNELLAEKKKTDKNILIGNLPFEEKFCKLAEDKKHIFDTIKMIAYRAETALANLIKPIISKQDEARKLIVSILKTEIDLEVDNQKNIRVKLHPLSTKSSNKAVQYLCDKLNETKTTYPGTNLTVYYELVA